jgi:hypothetical protein
MRKCSADRCRSACNSTGQRIVIDQSQPITSPYLMCMSDGCIAE